MPTSAPPIRLYQIYYDQETRQIGDPAFIPLDNLANERPDWSEYWPIRRLLLKERFTDDTYLGIFSPRFGEKTGMSGTQVVDVVSRSTADIISFSPFFDQNALHQSSFHQGEAHHEGLIPCCQAVADVLNLDLKLQELVADQTTSLFTNAFVARYSFWKVWFLAAEKIFRICEKVEGPLGEALSSGTLHGGEESTPMKVFVLERLVNLLMEHMGLHASIGIDLHKAPMSLMGTVDMIPGLVACDALKGQFRRTGIALYRDVYVSHRNHIARTLANAGIPSYGLRSYVV